MGSDVGTVRTFANLNLLESDLNGSGSGARRAELAEGLSVLIRNGNLLHVEIRLPDGTVVASERLGLVGTRRPVTQDFGVAKGGTIAPAVLVDGAPKRSRLCRSRPRPSSANICRSPRTAESAQSLVSGGMRPPSSRRWTPSVATSSW